MDNEQKNPNTQQPDNWLDDILGLSNSPKELGPDELAVQAAGLAHPDDMELEKILAEDWDSIPDLDTEAEQVPANEAVQDSSASNDPVLQEYVPDTDTSVEEVADPISEPAAEPVVGQTQFFTPVTDQTQVVPASDPEPVEEPKPVEPETPVRKTRPAKKKGYGLLGIPHILSTVIWLVIILAIGVTLGRTLWVSCADLMAFGKPDRQATITITEGESIDSIAQKLADAELIEYPTLFKLFATLTDKDKAIDAGTFTLNSKLDYNALINNMIDYGPTREQITIMIPEGYTCAQIFALMEEKGVCSVEDLERYAAQGELGDYWFLEDIERGDKYCLEGFLFPDTYHFYTNDEPYNVLKKFLDGFDYRFTDLMHEKLESIQNRTGLDLDIREVVIIASMIERETANNSESYVISSVIHNRLRNAGDFPFLNIDATLIYALNGNIDPETGLSMPLTEEQMNMDHPYNTYVYRGLPPGPISNPGRNSLDAALDPDFDTGTYYYYVYNPQSGQHIFARYLWEHEQNIAYVNSLS